MRRLLAGHDTIECAYYLYAPYGDGDIDFERLIVQREEARLVKKGSPYPITLGGEEFHLHGSGTQSGFPFVIANPDYTISFGEYNKPSFFVKFRSEALWRDGPAELHYRFLNWAEGLGLEATEPEGLSRVDFTFDYHLPVVDFDADAFVTQSAKDVRWRNHRKTETTQLGVGDVVLRVYDKIAEIQQESGKVWFAQLWETFEDVWRIEWQIRKDMLKRFGIRTFADLDARQGALLFHLAESHDSLRIPQADSNRSRWPVHSLWVDLRAWMEDFDKGEQGHELSLGETLDTRRQRIGIAVYGYLKRLAAIMALKTGRDEMPVREAMWDLHDLLKSVHDKGTWPLDVTKRIDAMRLGQS